MSCIGVKTEFSCSVVQAILPIMHRLAKQGRTITYGDLVDCSIGVGKTLRDLGAISMNLANPLSLMNKFAIDVLGNPKFIPSVLVVNQRADKPGEKFYGEYGHCLKDKENELLDIRKKTSNEDWQKIIAESHNLKPNDSKYCYRSKDHYLHNWS
ncbi:MAG: hypothetical protein ORO03_01070 [Alphaproteobacteria bacterium]|nr:hypothetical protein [Alphaproteobacteria bacterium]